MFSQVVTHNFYAEISALHLIFVTRDTSKLNQNWFRSTKSAKLVTVIANQEMMRVKSSVEKIYWITTRECIRIKKFTRLSEILSQHELILSRYAEMILLATPKSKLFL